MNRIANQEVAYVLETGFEADLVLVQVQALALAQRRQGGQVELAR